MTESTVILPGTPGSNERFDALQAAWQQLGHGGELRQPPVTTDQGIDVYPVHFETSGKLIMGGRTWVATDGTIVYSSSVPSDWQENLGKYYQEACASDQPGRSVFNQPKKQN